MNLFLRPAFVAASFTILGCSVLIPSANAVVSTDIIPATPTLNGSLDLKITDTNSSIFYDVSVPGILATDNQVQKATKINAAINAALAVDNLGAFSSSLAGGTVTVTKTGGGGMTVGIIKDGTGQGNKLRIKDSGGNGENWFWRFVRYLSASNTTIPTGDNFTLETTSSLVATITGDGINSSSYWQDNITSQLVSQGVSFSQSIVSPGIISLTSQPYPVGTTFPAGGVGILSSDRYSTYLGGIGVELVPAPVPLLAPGVLFQLTRRMRRLSSKSKTLS